MRLLDDTRARLRRTRESGQAMVEFVLVLFPMVVLVGGVIQLGIGIANWHDLNRIANEGARFAATNEWPGCTTAQPTCTLDPTDPVTGELVCPDPDPSAPDGRSLLNYLRCEVKDAGLPGPASPAISPKICYPTAGTGAGEPVTVKLESRVNFLSLDQSDNKIQWAGVTLRGETTMRLSRAPTKVTPAPDPTC